MTASSIYRRLLHRGLRARVPLYRISLTANHQRLRLQWAYEHRAWQADWYHVVFSDESRFNLWDHNCRIRVRRYAGEHCIPECVIKRHSDLTPGSSGFRYFGVGRYLSHCSCKDNLVALHFKYDQARRRFVEWTQNEIAVVPDFHKRILFSDEAHFWLNDYVNKQNCRIWSEANLQVHVETPLHPEKLTVWCTLWAGGIIGPYFFKNDEGHHVTVNVDRYRNMITNFFIPELNNHDVQELWFQQDGATCHTARATIDLLKDTFGDRLISRFGPVNWPPRSCDLTPLDYFLWGYVKSLVYADKPQKLDHLEDNIRRVISDIRPQMLEKVIENWAPRLDYI
ncbi:putative DD41D transposase [Trichonephila clavipes]|nr:putative DD41D transposase [Trichonephila clavipes]